MIILCSLCKLFWLDRLEEDEFRHFAVISGGEGGRRAGRPREGDRGEPGTVLDGVEVEAAYSMVAVHNRNLTAVVVVGVGRGFVMVGEVARLFPHRQDESVGAVADGADPPVGRHSYGRPISDWKEELSFLAHAVWVNWDHIKK